MGFSKSKNEKRRTPNGMTIQSRNIRDTYMLDYESNRIMN